MLDLDDSRFKELGYRIATLNCVCNDNKFNQNFKHQFSQTNQSPSVTSSLTSSPASSQYSSPINSPPLSPSSVSSYSSAEEDFSDDLKFNFKFNYSDTANDNLEDSNSRLADLLTVDHRDYESNQSNAISCDQYDQFKSEYVYENQAFKDSESTSDTSSDQLDNQLDDHLENQFDKQLDKTSRLNNSDQPRVRKTSILRNQKPSELIDCESKKDCKKAVKFADTLGYQLEKVKYYPVNPTQPNYNQVNLANLYCDYLDDYDHQENLFFLHNRKPVKTNLKSKSLQSFNKPSGASTSLFNGNQKRTCTLPQNQTNVTRPSSHLMNCRSANYQPFGYTSNYLPFSPMKDQYCDMFYQPNYDNTFYNQRDFNPNTTRSTTELSDNSKKLDSIDNYSQIYKLSKIEFDGLNFMNNQDFFLNNQHRQDTNQQNFSILPLNFGQSYIHSDFPNRLRMQSVLLHSIHITNDDFINGQISVMNLTFEKKIIVKYTFDKWLTEHECIAKYLNKDQDNSDEFSFQLHLKTSDFPPFKSNEDHILMFAIRYETGDGRIFWDNNYGQDYRLKCKLN